MTQQLEKNNVSEIKSRVTASPERFAPRISLHDEKRLGRYFGPLEAAFRRSTFGAMIDRLARDSRGSAPCQRCNGIGFSDEDLVQTTRALKRLEGQRLAAIARIDAVDAWAEYRAKAEECEPKCFMCRGTGAVPGASPGQKPVLNVKSWQRDRIGWTSRIVNGREQRRARWGPWEPVWLDANMKKQGSDHTPSMLNHDVLVEYAKTSRDLDRVREVSQRTFALLEIYYGDEGAVWGRTRHGRMFALYRLTPEAHKLLGKGQQDNPTDLGVSARLAVEADLDRQQPKSWRRQLLNAADEKVRRWYDQACGVWQKARRGGEPDWRDRYRELVESIGQRRSEEGKRPLKSGRAA